MKKLYFFGLLLVSTFSSSFAQNVPSYVPTTGLVGWWACSGNAADSSGSGNNGVTNGATLSADRNSNPNSAYSFNGTSNYIALTNGMSSTLTAGKVSAAAWVYFNSNATWATVIKNWGSVSKGAYHLGLNDATQKLQVQIAQANNTAVSVTAPSTISLNAWHHVAFTADGSLVHLYQDGVEIASAVSYNGTLFTTFLYTNIGAKPSTTNTPASFPGYIDGKVDDIGLWNIALTQQQITGLYLSQPTGINSLTSLNALTVYPNPASSVLHIQAKNLLSNTTLRVMDVLGNELKNEKVSTSNHDLSLIDLPNGIYFIELRDKEEIVRKKIIKE
jgi:Concanavalin A-like lectin/glucanases superfamily/Secretion system C-terminal sorting domain